MPADAVEVAEVSFDQTPGGVAPVRTDVRLLHHPRVEGVEVVEHRHANAVPQKRVDQMAADESGPSRDEYMRHALGSLATTSRDRHAAGFHAGQGATGVYQFGQTCGKPGTSEAASVTRQGLARITASSGARVTGGLRYAAHRMRAYLKARSAAQAAHRQPLKM
jgi:hypothetical protein